MQTNLHLKGLIIFVASLNVSLLAQNCRLDLTPVSPDVLANNKIKEVKVYKTEPSGNKINYQNFFIDVNGVCNKEFFYVDPAKNVNPIISECTFDQKNNSSVFTKRLTINGIERSILRDEEYYNENGKLVKKISVEGDESIEKTVLLRDPKDPDKEDKRFYKIVVAQNDTTTKVYNIKTAKKHSYYLKHKTGSGYQTEASETIYDSPTSGTVKVYRNDKLINQYEFGKDKKGKNPDEDYREPFGLPYNEPKFKNVYTNDGDTYVLVKDTMNCKYLAKIKDENGIRTVLLSDRKTGLLLREVNTHNGKRIEGREYEYVK